MALHEGAFPSQDRGIVRLARFRRLAALVGASALVLVVAVPGAAAAGPERSPNGAGSSTLLAGEYCSFAVQWDTVKATGQTLVFSVDGNGDQLVRIVGYVETRMTNLDSGASKLYGGGNREDLLFHADGTVSATIDGAVIAAYGVPDVNGPSVWFYRGHLQDEVDNTFTATAHAFVGKAVNVCTDLGQVEAGDRPVGAIVASWQITVREDETGTCASASLTTAPGSAPGDRVPVAIMVKPNFQRPTGLIGPRHDPS